MQDIGLFWQLTIKTIDDLSIVGNENLTLEMYIMQLVYLKNIDARKETQNLENYQQSDKNLIGKKIDDKTLETNIPNQIKNQLKSTNQIKTNPVKKIDLDSIIDQISDENIEIDSDDDLILQAQNLARGQKTLSTSYLQRRLRIGYPRAARLMDELEDQGVVGPGDSGKPREVL